MLKIVIKYHDKDIPELQRTELGDWIDLYAAEDKDIRQGTYDRISLGVSMMLPEGYEAHVVPRSSTFKNWGISLITHTAVIMTFGKCLCMLSGIHT